MKELKLKDVEETIHYKKIKNLDTYMWINENVNNYYITLSVKYGSIHTKFKSNNKEIKAPEGIAHFLEHTKFNVSKNKTAEEFFDRHGLSINAFTTYEFTGYEVTGVKDFIKALKYLIYYVNNPYFTKELIEKEKGIITEEIKMGLDNPFRKLYNEKNNALFKNINYKNEIAGTIEEVNNTTVEDIKTVFDNFYNIENMFLVITGNFNKEKACEAIEEQLTKMNLPSSLNPTLIEDKEPLEVNIKEKTIESNITIPKTNISYKISLDNITEKNQTKLKQMISILLNNTFGESSSLKEQLLKEEKISSLTYNKNIIDKFLIITLTYESKKSKEVKDILTKAMENLYIDEDKLNLRKRATTGEYIKQFDDIEYINSTIQDQIIYNNKLILDVLSIYKSITLEELNTIKKEIITDNYSIINMIPYTK